MRDEAHRFSRVLHHKAEKKRIFKSWVDDIKGIGLEKKNKIKKKITKTVDDYKKMSVDELQQDLDLSRDLAGKIYSHFYQLES